MNLTRQFRSKIILIGKVIGLVFGILEQYRQKIYVSPRVLQLSLNYLRERYD